MMQLQTVISATKAATYATTGALDMVVSADLGDGVADYPFAYLPSDENGLGPAVTVWLAENPGFAIGDYVAPVPTGGDVNAERARRILAGATIAVTGAGNIPLTGGEDDKSNLSNQAMAAKARIDAGDVATTTVWRDRNNVNHDLTPPQVWELWSKAAGYVSDLYGASWAIKALDPIPADYADDSRWPSSTVA